MMRFNFSSTTIAFSFLVAFSYAQPQFLRRGGGGKFQDVLATTRTDGVLYQNDVEITTPNEVLDQGDIHDHQKDIVNGLKNQIIEKATRTFSRAEQSKDPTTTVVTFSEGFEGFSNGISNTILSCGGNPGANVRVFNPDTFGVGLNTDTNKEFLGDYFDRNIVRIGIDVKVNSIKFHGSEVKREFVIQLFDKTIGDDGEVSVWYNFGELPPSKSGWVSLTVDIPLQEELPPRWGGTGSSGENYEFILPADRTYGSVLTNVASISFTTYVPGFVYGFTYFDMQIDNVSITSNKD